MFIGLEQYWCYGMYMYMYVTESYCWYKGVIVDEVEVPADVSETISRNPVGYGGVMESWTSSHMLRIESLWHVQLHYCSIALQF